MTPIFCLITFFLKFKTKQKVFPLQNTHIKKYAPPTPPPPLRTRLLLSVMNIHALLREWEKIRLERVVRYSYNELICPVMSFCVSCPILSCLSCPVMTCFVMSCHIFLCNFLSFVFRFVNLFFLYFFNNF